MWPKDVPLHRRAAKQVLPLRMMMAVENEADQPVPMNSCLYLPHAN